MAQIRPRNLSLAGLLFVLWAFAAQAADEDRTLAALTTDAASAQAAVETVRASSPMTSSLPDVDAHLARLLRWVAADYARSGALKLVSAAPEGRNAAGAVNARLAALRETYWLQDNASYVAGALRQYAPVLGAALEASWRAKWEQRFSSFCPNAESQVVVGERPAYDGGPGRDEPRCRTDAPGAWKMLRMRQYPEPSQAGFDALPKPIVGTDYPGFADGRFAPEANINRKSPRDLLKYGCLRQTLLGRSALASEMFDAALALWDGEGFVEPKAIDDDGVATGQYWTRDLAFALLCANALGQGGRAQFGETAKVSKAEVERRLWRLQTPSGGIWTNYCAPEGRENCPRGGVPPVAKATNEIAPLTLLAYGQNIWTR